MECKNGHAMHVIDSRKRGNVTRRRYGCDSCSERITTEEIQIGSGHAASARRRHRATRIVQSIELLKRELADLATEIRLLRLDG